MENDLLFVSYLMAFADKFKLMHWAAANHTIHTVLDDFHGELEEFKDAIAENIQSIIGLFNNDLFNAINIPVGDNVENMLLKLEKCIVKWFELHKNEMKYEGCRNACSGFLETIHKYIYLIRLC